MKIAVSAEGTDLDAAPCPTFGRSPYLLLYETQTKNVDSIRNPGVEADHGAGVEAAQCVVSHGASIVCTGRMGPNAWEVCETAGIAVHASAGATVREVIERSEAGTLAPLSPAAPRGGGGGRGGGGRGRGGGGRGGRGGGRGGGGGRRRR